MKTVLIQMNSTDDKAVNIEAAIAWVERAARAEQPQLIVLPELFTYLGGTPQGARAAAEAFAGSGLHRRLGELAADLKVHLHAGSMVERDSGDYYNATAVFGPDGRQVARYRKIHLFDVTTPDGVVYNESTVYRPGNSIDSYLVGGHRVGCSICYDLRFPELYLKLAQQGVQVIVVPAAFTLQTGKDHWEVLCRARAIEAQAYVLAANQYGQYEEEGIMRANYGNSMVVDPWGKVIARAQDKACYISAELDFDYLAEVRSNLPSLRHRVLATGER